jgi:putative membrane protein
MQDLMKKKVKDFDKAYTGKMVYVHKNDIKVFEKTANECKDPEIKNFAAKHCQY